MEQINPIESKIINSVEYNCFIENNPDLKTKIDNIIKNFVQWKKYNFYGSNKKDFCYLSKKTLPYSDSWSVDEPAEFGTAAREICKTWHRFEGQMGTTEDKFEITDDDVETSRLIGEVFEKIGFKVFVVTFTHWRVGYDFEFVKLSDIKGKIITAADQRDIHSVHICISRY
jgi:hypothetical protein